MDVRWINLGGLRVLHLNLAGFTLPQLEEAKKLVARAAAEIRACGPASVATLTDVSDAAFNDETNRLMQDLATGNKPHVFAAAVIGATGLRRSVVSCIKVVTGRNISCCADRAEAERWLREQATLTRQRGF